MHSSRRLFVPSTTSASHTHANNIKKKKQLWIVRHGQAAHNPRAEKAREAGCSHEEFLEIMKQDDVRDAPITALGKQQAVQLSQTQSFRTTVGGNVSLIVSSPLSRAIETADLVLPPPSNHDRTTTTTTKRVCIEEFREVNGWLLNAQRRNRSELKERFPAWDFDRISETDTMWTPELEEQVECAQRGYKGLCWLMEQPETNILLVCHGGLLRFTMNMHPNVCVVDDRRRLTPSSSDREVKARFGNCEMRRFVLTWDSDTAGNDGQRHEDSEPTVTLAEIDL